MKPLTIHQLTQKAAEHRKTLIDVTYKTGGAYLAQALSCIDMLTCIFYRYMHFQPNQPQWEQRDRFLLSPGHYALPLYVTLADLGYFDPSLLYSFKENGSPLELATHKDTVPGIEVSGGSLGQVLSVGVGMALAAKMDNQSHRIFVMMSDGEQDEGQIWEAAASAAHFKLNNITAVLDKNGFQVDGPTTEVMNMDSLADKYAAFGWKVHQADGNDPNKICDAMDSLLDSPSGPGIFIGETIRGKGLRFMEGNPAFHYTRLDETLAEQANQELKAGWDAV